MHQLHSSLIIQGSADQKQESGELVVHQSRRVIDPISYRNLLNKQSDGILFVFER